MLAKNIFEQRAPTRCVNKGAERAVAKRTTGEQSKPIKARRSKHKHAAPLFTPTYKFWARGVCAWFPAQRAHLHLALRLA